MVRVSQIAGLGQTAISRRFAISSLDEARAHLGHAVLGPRLLECCGLVVAPRRQRAEQIFGAVDAQKLRSSMTLFMRADPEEPLFEQVLDRFYAGQPDAATDERL